ncbi:MAG: TetR/AcrR family transcriptional regulator [Actinomycetota bacterium]|nr:TetR/AcrR family transcriptional regulator [Actinomycetota bacterium]
MATAASTARRQLSTAEERREAALRAASRVFAERGYHGTPTMEIAREAGISQAYLFRLFPTKAELFGAVCERCLSRLHEAFAGAARDAKAKGEPVPPAMGAAYGELIQDREILLNQLHAHAAAASDPAVREVMRRGWADLYALVSEASGESPEEVRRFFAAGMLMNVMVALDAVDLDADWAVALCTPPESA